MPIADGLAGRAEELERVVADGSLDPADRVLAIRKFRDDLILGHRGEPPGSVADEFAALIGRCDTYIGSLELAREGEALGRVWERALVAEDADVREVLRAEGMAEADLDAAGLPPRATLDEAAEDGTLEEGFGASLNPALLRTLALKRRRNEGRFADELGSPAKPKGRGGAALPGSDKKSYDERRESLQRRTTDAARQGVVARGPLSPGTEPDTSPTPDPYAPREFGHASQKELLAYANAARTQPSTVDAYAGRDEQGRRVYDETRQATHEKIISKLLDSVPSQPAGEARVFFSGGGYASGKGGVVDSHKDVPPDALVLDPDTIKGELPEFQELLEEDPEANLLVYEEAWDISQEVQRRAIEKNANVVVDGISDTSPDDMLNRVRLFTEAGYTEPKVVYVSIPTEEAITRAEKRARKAKKPSDRRFIPEVIMRSVHRDVSATMPGIVAGAAELGLSIEVWDNDQGWNAEQDEPVPPKQFFRFDPKEGKSVLDEGLWQTFLAKGSERIAGVDDG